MDPKSLLVHTYCCLMSYFEITDGEVFYAKYLAVILNYKKKDSGRVYHARLLLAWGIASVSITLVGWMRTGIPDIFIYSIIYACKEMICVYNTIYYGSMRCIAYMYFTHVIFQSLPQLLKFTQDVDSILFVVDYVFNT